MPVDPYSPEFASLMRQQAHVFWFTGLSGSGKTTLVTALREQLVAREFKATIIDGDEIRRSLCRDLGFSLSDRMENVRRTAEVCRMFADAGFVVLASLISPLAAHRGMARSVVGPARFAEIFVECPLSVCESRDPRGLYRKARAGEIPQFTGIDSPYEPPEAPDFIVRTNETSVEQSVSGLVEFVLPRIRPV